MRILRSFIIMGAGLFLFACSSTEVVPPTTTSTDFPATLTSTLPAPTDTRFPTQTPKPTTAITVSSSRDTATPGPAFQICSPLAEQTLQELQEIISGPYDPPLDGGDARHHGTDFAYYRRKDRTTVEGEIVQSILPGKVILVIYDQLPYGNMVILETTFVALPKELALELGMKPDESLYHLYAHFRSEPLVEIGEWVDCGQALGEVGTTGYNIVNPHLHLETRIGPAGAAFVDGMRYYDTRATEGEQANYELWRTSGVFRHFDPMELIIAYLENGLEE